ncbi:cytochrome c oxidase assembly factor 4 homolog, mitochondrial-like [Rhopilema esculentum]|uniref:cytochrome c oxidase assembly factor 4 homolog, mitochondrial-like n=1 Tax=Rhopilema esculentum TaxID=499914 RepID=UPI0031E2CC03
MEREDGKKSEASSIEDNEDEEDPFETRIGGSGCSKYHYALQDCYFEKKDWRLCKEEMKRFRKCMNEQKKK